MTEPVTRVVNNRTLLLGLDKLYRDRMKRFEADKLLVCARRVARELSVSPVDIPVEGYYSENVNLTEYFKLMRALQGKPRDQQSVISHLPEFQLLLDVTSSRLYGRPQEADSLFPTGRDALTQALADSRGISWDVPRLVDAAYEAAVRFDDFSLVGVAALTKDPVAITALRESVVLYAELGLWDVDDEPEYSYEWQVGKNIQEAANRFIATFNDFVPEAIRPAGPENAAYFYNACSDNKVLGRCVRIGDDPESGEHYHWAIRTGEGELEVDEFWSTEIWTTDRYGAEKLHPGN